MAVAMAAANAGAKAASTALASANTSSTSVPPPAPTFVSTPAAFPTTMPGPFPSPETGTSCTSDFDTCTGSGTGNIACHVQCITNLIFPGYTWKDISSTCGYFGTCLESGGRNSGTPCDGNYVGAASDYPGICL